MLSQHPGVAATPRGLLDASIGLASTPASQESAPEASAGRPEILSFQVPSAPLVPYLPRQLDEAAPRQGLPGERFQWHPLRS